MVVRADEENLQVRKGDPVPAHLGNAKPLSTLSNFKYFGCRVTFKLERGQGPLPNLKFGEPNLKFGERPVF
jgi:hypothetical protein